MTTHVTLLAEAKREREMQSREYGMVAPPPSLGGGDAVQTSLKKDDDVIREAEACYKGLIARIAWFPAI